MNLKSRFGVAALAGALALAAALPAMAQPPSIELPSSGSVAVIEYNVIHEMLAESDPEPLVKVFANGWVRVHLPSYMANAGDYRVRLTTQELRQLLADLAADGVMDFDRASASADRQAAAAAARGAGILHHVSDVSETLIDIKLGSYRSAGAVLTQNDFTKSIRWPNVYTDARQFQSVAQLQGLARAEERLRAILNRPDLTPIR